MATPALLPTAPGTVQLVGQYLRGSQALDFCMQASTSRARDVHALQWEADPNAAS
jgi:hypothetical protein